jgi:hypothetical protein
MRLVILLFKGVTWVLSLILKPMVPQDAGLHRKIGYAGVGLGVVCLLPILICVWTILGDKTKEGYFAVAMWLFGLGIIALTVSAAWFRAAQEE